MLFHARRSAGGHQKLATILKHPAKAVQVSQSDRPDKQVSEALRLLPLAAGGTGFLALLVNRVTSGVAPVVDASSSQSRVDVLVIALAATLALTGFQWLALKPVQRTRVRAPTRCHVLCCRVALSVAMHLHAVWQQALKLRQLCTLLHCRGSCVVADMTCLEPSRARC